MSAIPRTPFAPGVAKSQGTTRWTPASLAASMTSFWSPSAGPATALMSTETPWSACLRLSMLSLMSPARISTPAARRASVDGLEMDKGRTRAAMRYKRAMLEPQ